MMFLAVGCRLNFSRAFRPFVDSQNSFLLAENVVQVYLSAVFPARHSGQMDDAQSVGFQYVCAVGSPALVNEP